MALKNMITSMVVRVSPPPKLKYRGGKNVKSSERAMVEELNSGEVVDFKITGDHADLRKVAMAVRVMVCTIKKSNGRKYTTRTDVEKMVISVYRI